MDKFEKMTEEEHKKASKTNKKQCICPNCPTYNECAKEKGELFYCTVGRSKACIIKESGCICPACPITEIMGLTKDYFCIRGTESQQRGIT